MTHVQRVGLVHACDLIRLRLKSMSDIRCDEGRSLIAAAEWIAHQLGVDDRRRRKRGTYR